MPKQPAICCSDTDVAGPGTPKPPATVEIVPAGTVRLALGVAPARPAGPANVTAAASAALAASRLATDLDRFIATPQQPLHILNPYNTDAPHRSRVYKPFLCHDLNVIDTRECRCVRSRNVFPLMVLSCELYG